MKTSKITQQGSSTSGSYQAYRNKQNTQNSEERESFPLAAETSCKLKNGKNFRSKDKCVKAKVARISDNSKWIQATAHIPCKPWEPVKVRMNTSISTRLRNLNSLYSCGQVMGTIRGF